MKNFIITFVCLLTFATSYGQDTKPTKKETMDWIAGKFKNYTNANGGGNAYWTFSFQFISAIDSKIRLLKTSFSVEDGEKKIVSEVVVDLSKITNISTTPPNNRVTKSLEIMGMQNLIIVDSKYSQDNYSIYYEFDNGMKGSLINFNAEPNLYERFIKALQILVEYNNSEKPKEKF